MRPLISFGPPKSIPAFITANPIDMDGVYMISRFRSGAGHDYSYGAWNEETCRSMKHYFNTSRSNNAQGPIRSQPTATEPNITLYSPFDGKITQAQKEHVGTEVHIRSAQYPSYYIRLFHIDLLSSLKVGSKVRSGQPVGTIGPKDGTDIAVEAYLLSPGKTLFISMFEVMTDAAFAPYAKLGFRRSDFILTKAERDAEPLQCGGAPQGQGFIRDPDYRWQDDFLHLKVDPYMQDQGPGAIPLHIGPPLRN